MAAEVKSSRTLKILLAASLLGNVFVGGVLVGGAFKDRVEREPPPGMQGYVRPQVLVQSLPEARRNDVRLRLMSEIPRVRPLFREMFTSRRDLVDVLSGEPLDIVKLRDVMERVSTAESELRGTSFDIFLELMEELPPEERVMVAQGVLKHIRNRHKPMRIPLDGPPEGLGDGPFGGPPQFERDETGAMPPPAEPVPPGGN